MQERPTGFNMLKLLQTLLIYCTSTVILSVSAMTPKYPYDPVVTTCLNEVTLVGEGFINADTQQPLLRLQADLTILEDAEIANCPSIPNIKFVFLKFNTDESALKFNELIGVNVSVTGSIQSGGAPNLKQVTFTTETIAPIE